ncbi:branched-chain amino acid ABC transporter permease [Marinobacter sp. M3C]|jgi:branched-chain amino acid transport system permease protein|uniref:branched-chain amino acid ABC transporter permease n=1 Tax=unclassified Marinobacter TaxID=83889 RepID=UPI00200F5E1C|nr:MULTISPECIES: branched-chain amino acid ABC transporter permease [unclassified Marinobacter]MCL1478478.1 branched-chain amino acid ABC transporter permease [Marinobacter sp.]MCL1485955.1 branched-chain amino acid ABC transporter permease [Marinobacter sp.]UQG55969.1 branched-chain amino acid ABC transporter permease [Marinobacter sp. M4C]UQG58596.1 branched-chain amino acid ABC transporter permease [Marinobacter sp. M3C]UQG64774.1 branched-chain amino acid ABC transporter permease [Marinoba
MSGIGSALLNSLDIGLLLFIIAVGLNIVFGVLNIINFAHGALYMLGAYLAFTLINIVGMPFWAALLLAPLGVAILAVLIDRFLLRYIYSRDIGDSLLLTFALLLIINESVRLIWGSGIQVVQPPQLLAGSIDIIGSSIPTYSLFVIVMGLVLLAGLWFLFNRTRIGRIMRAAALDRDMAEVLCINTRLVVTGVFAFGAWLAAVGGVIAAPMRALDPGMGDKIIIESFIVVVIGGLGSFPGALLGAIILGLIHGFGGRYFPEVNMLLPFLGMALVLLFKPNGIMGKGAAA